jgi:excisionase family DNA binding protein
MKEPLYPPRGMSRTEAAAYIGVSPSLFDEMVKDGRMPGPKLGRTVWALSPRFVTASMRRLCTLGRWGLLRAGL